MTGSRGRLTAGVAALSLALAACPAGAADEPVAGDQVREAARDAPQAADAPPRSILLEPSGTKGVAPDLPAFGKMPEPSGGPDLEPILGGEIEVGTLDAESTTVGALGPETGGFSRFLWDGSDGKVMARLLGLADPGASPAVQALTRRLLLTAAPPPAGLSEDKFLSVRLQLLARLGDLDGILELVNRAGMRLDPEGAERIKLDALLLSGDFVGACSYAADEISRQDDPYWLQAVTFCRAVDNDRPGANLSLELLQDRAVEAPVFYKLIGALLNRSEDSEPPVVASMEAPSALDVTMATLLGVSVPEDVASGASPLVLTRLAGLAAVPLELRLEIASSAAAAGGFPPSRLAQIYANIKFTDNERHNAALLAETAQGARGDALLYQAALGAGSAMDRALVLKAGADRAGGTGTLALYATLNREALRTLPPDAAVMPLAPSIVRLLLLAGERDAALAWYRYVRDAGAAGDGNARAALVDMWPLAVVGAGGGEVPVSAEILDLWWQGRQTVAAADSTSQAQLLYALFEALGQSIPDAYWPDMMSAAETTPVNIPSLPVWRGLLKAGAEGHQGETAVYAVSALTEGGPGASAPTVVGSVVRALDNVGIGDSARAIALEAMAARGL